VRTDQTGHQGATFTVQNEVRFGHAKVRWSSASGSDLGNFPAYDADILSHQQSLVNTVKDVAVLEEGLAGDWEAIAGISWVEDAGLGVPGMEDAAVDHGESRN